MKTLFQKLITLPELFHKEPPKKLVQQKRSAKQKIAFAALSSFTAMGASYLTNRYLSSNINIPNSSVSNTINSALKIVGSITALAGLTGLLTYATNQPNIIQKEKSHTKIENPNDAVVPKEETNSISSNNTNSQTPLIQNENPTHYYIVQLFYEFRAGGKINKNLLEKLISTYIDLRKTSPKSTISNKTFILDCITIIKDYQILSLTSEVSPDVKKSNLNKIIDILDVITGRTDLLSCQLVNQLFPDIIPDGLHKMTQMIDLEDKEYQVIIERSRQLIYKALTQQMKILFKDGIIFKTQSSLDKAFNRILDLLTPFKDDHLRLGPNFYINFFHSSKHAWRFFHLHLSENIFSNDLSLTIDSSPDMIIADFLNARDSKDDHDDDKSFSNYTYEDGLDILKKIMIGARLSLFLDESNQMAASFAIRLMQHKLEIDPKDFEKDFPSDNRLLKQLYLELCGTENLKPFENYAYENNLCRQATLIANALIRECATTSLVNLLFGSDITKLGQSFINKIVLLSQKKEYLKDDNPDIRLLSYFIESQILDPSIPQRAELAVLALNHYPEVFLNEESVNLIRQAYRTQIVNHKELDSACQKFLKTCKNFPEMNTKIETELKNSQLTNSTLPKSNEIEGQALLEG